MERTIAVEDGLGPIKELLSRRGYKVVPLKPGAGVDAAVVSGMDVNMMDMQTREIDAPIINAAGRTPGDVLQELENKFLH